MEKKFIIKDALKDAVLKKNEYNGYSLGYVHSLLGDYPDIKFFESKEEAESYIIEKSLTQVTIVEIFI